MYQAINMILWSKNQISLILLSSYKDLIIPKKKKNPYDYFIFR